MTSLATRVIWCPMAMFLAAISAVSVEAQTTQPSMDFLRASERDLQWFREARFGLFVCWGPVSLKGTEIGWSRGGEHRNPERGEFA